ncbi:hypothetical protein OIU77_020382 [Salix suchowensis]|uniref:Uncharacterized protein n=1 Tax=Salix suchowensis TaxID=1278906 RepID=A0ABQ9CPA4_9ROSI|nr:hypothetical protein OIU77_020382 [Salix suchowensis]
MAGEFLFWDEEDCTIPLADDSEGVFDGVPVSECECSFLWTWPDPSEIRPFLYLTPARVLLACQNKHSKRRSVQSRRQERMKLYWAVMTTRPLGLTISSVGSRINARGSTSSPAVQTQSC